MFWIFGCCFPGSLRIQASSWSGFGFYTCSQCDILHSCTIHQRYFTQVPCSRGAPPPFGARRSAQGWQAEGPGKSTKIAIPRKTIVRTFNHGVRHLCLKRCILYPDCLCQEIHILPPQTRKRICWTCISLLACNVQLQSSSSTFSHALKSFFFDLVKHFQKFCCDFLQLFCVGTGSFNFQETPWSIVASSKTPLHDLLRKRLKEMHFKRSTLSC